MSAVDPVQVAQKFQRMPSREKAIFMRIMARLLNWPPGAPPTKEQVAGWLRAEGAAESVVYSFIKSMDEETPHD
jgi:hypothetical protein